MRPVPITFVTTVCRAPPARGALRTRSRDRARRVGRSESVSASALPAAGPDPAGIVARRDENDHVWALAAEVLSANQHAALWLRYAEDMSVKDIAGVMKKSTGNVKVLLHRARRKLLERHPVSTPSARTAPSTQSHYVARTS